MKRKHFLKFLPVLFLLAFISENSYAQTTGQKPQTTDYAHLVDTRIGSEGNGLSCGYTYIGASYPFGMIQFTPSFFSPQKGIVVNQISGSGCAHMGNFPILLLSGQLTKYPKDMNDFPHYESVKKATAGCLSLQMKDGTICNVTTSKRSGITQFVFPTDKKEGTILIGVGVSSTELSNAYISPKSA